MAEEISNRALAILLIAAIVVSLGGTFISLNRLSRLSSTTGLLTSPTGTAQVNVSQTASIRFSLATLNFGIGSVNTTNGNQYCSMASGNNTVGAEIDDITRCIGFNAANTFNSLEIENDGNRNMTLTINSNKNAADFIGGTLPGFKFYVTNNETNACPSAVPAVWSDVNKSVENNICGDKGLDFTDAADSLDIHLNITIPYNSLTGQQQVTLTVSGTNLV